MHDDRQFRHAAELSSAHKQATLSDSYWSRASPGQLTDQLVQPTSTPAPPPHAVSDQSMPLLLSLMPALLCFPLRGLQCCCSPCPRQIYVTAMEIKLWSRLNLDHLTAHMCLKKKNVKFMLLNTDSPPSTKHSHRRNTPRICYRQSSGSVRWRSASAQLTGSILSTASTKAMCGN